MARRHFEYQAIQPIGQQIFGIWRIARDRDRFLGLHQGRIADHRRHRQSRLLERLAQRVADAAHADIGAMGEMFPVGHGLRIAEFFMGYP